jgi:hypothetical protein
MIALLFACNSTITTGDVLYKPDLPRIFFDTVRQILLRRQQQEQKQQDLHTDDINNNQQSSNCIGSGGILWLCHVPRSTVTHELVLQAANQTGFTVEQTISLGRLKQTRSNKSIDKFLDGCPLEDVVRARVYRMVLQTEVGQVKKIVNR